MPVASRGEWLNPLNRMVWQKAFKSKQTKMTLRNGQKFSIEYDCNGREGKVWVQIVKGYEKSGFDPFTPCGWFDYEEVTDPQWVKGEKSESTEESTSTPAEKRKSATEMIADMQASENESGVMNGESEQD